MHDEPGSNHRAWSWRTWPGWGVAATLWCLLHGCDTVSGGAVELSWKLRPASSSLDDKFVDCDSGRDGTGPVTRIRLHWEVENESADPAGKVGSRAWDCAFNHAVTGFDLAEGVANLWVTPECASGPASADTYVAPALVQRNVIRGDTISLGAIELVVAVSYCQPANPDGVPCICAPAP